MRLTGVVLYGPPASGKSAVTAELGALDSRFTLFERLRASQTPKPGYRNITAAEADALVAQGQVLYENSRYGNRYIVDRGEVRRLTSAGLVPVLHLGQIEGIRAVMLRSGQWLTVRLLCARETTLKRSHERGDSDVLQRLAAWDQTAEDLARNEAFPFALRLDSDYLSAHQSAAMIAAAFFSQRST